MVAWIFLCCRIIAGKYRTSRGEEEGGGDTVPDLFGLWLPNPLHYLGEERPATHIRPEN